MIGARAAFLAIILLTGVAAPLHAADADKPSAAATARQPSVALDGKLRHPQSLDLAALQKLPAEHVQVSFQGEHGTTTADYTGPLLWAVLAAVGGLDDAQKGAEIRHIIRVTGRDGYVVVLSTGEIAPEFGGKPALLAYQLGTEPPGKSGLRLIMPGDKRGGRDVRDVVSIRVE